MTGKVALRDVTEEDLPIFFLHQTDPVATQMADFPSRDREAFMTHWLKILADDSIVKKTILYNGQVAGNVVCFEQHGKREVGYWIDRAFWGKGIATRALDALLQTEQIRPLFAWVVKHNIASQRVLEKCNFVRIGKEGEGYIFQWNGTIAAGTINDGTINDGTISD